MSLAIRPQKKGEPCDECPSQEANVLSLITHGEYCGKACLDIGVERHLRSMARLKGDVK